MFMTILYLFVVSLTTIFSDSGYIASNERVLSKDELERF
jgi:hypothetical protein